MPLTDTQLVVLSAALARPDGSILPLPASLKGGAIAKVCAALLAKGLAEEVGVDPTAARATPEQLYRTGDNPIVLRITPLARQALNADDTDGASAQAEQASQPPAAGKKTVSSAGKPKRSAPPSVAPVAREKEAAAARASDGNDADQTAKQPREGTKLAALITLLRRAEGVSIKEASAALDWMEHSVRGAVAGALKKKLGLTILAEKVEGRGTVYRVGG